MTAGFATALGHSRLCFWPEISETKMFGKRKNHRTMLRASKTIPANGLSVLLHALGMTAVWKISPSPSVQKKRKSN